MTQMKKGRYTEEQIAFALQQAEHGTSVAEVYQKMGVTEQSFYRWKKKFGGMLPGDVKKLKRLEDENAKLKRLVADLSLDKAMLQDVLSNNRQGLLTGEGQRSIFRSNIPSVNGGCVLR
ncbi:MAG: transposase [Clostridiales bacterium]|nr:transposase [Clostridiales bacterium]